MRLIKKLIILILDIVLKLRLKFRHGKGIAFIIVEITYKHFYMIEQQYFLEWYGHAVALFSHLKCEQSDLRYALSVKCTVVFEDLA